MGLTSLVGRSGEHLLWKMNGSYDDDDDSDDDDDDDDDDNDDDDDDIFTSP